MELTPQMLACTRARTLNYLRYKFNRNSREIYEDAVQKAFFDLYEKKLEAKFVTENHLFKWLRTAAWWHAIKELKARSRQVPASVVIGNGCDDEGVNDFENKELVEKFRSSLSSKKAEAIEKILQGFTINEIAKSVTEKADTVKHRYNSALKVMQNFWKIESRKK